MLNHLLRAGLLTCLLCLGLGSCSLEHRPSAGQLAPAPLHGVCFGPFVGDMEPRESPRLSEPQLQAMLTRLVPFTRWIRTYGADAGLDCVGRISHRLGLKVAMGCWLGRDLAANERSIAGLIDAAGRSEVDIAIVGSEVLYRGDLTAQQLLDYVQRVRARVPSSVPVTTAEVATQLLANPALIHGVDVVFYHSYPFWEGVRIDRAVSTLHCWYQRLLHASAGKPVYLAETGWPTSGDRIGGAVPSLENAATYLREFVAWARVERVPFFYFEAHDEPWKARHEGSRGAHWGLCTPDGVLKPGMAAALAGGSALEWRDKGPAQTAAAPRLELMPVPGHGTNGTLRGLVLGADPTRHAVVVYLDVDGTLWHKPSPNGPLIYPGWDGEWCVEIADTSPDGRSGRVLAFLVPDTCQPPRAAGWKSLPDAFLASALAQVQAAR